MKQLVFMLTTFLLGTAGSFALSPVYGIAVYYLYAVLRPQFIWDWVTIGGIRLDEPRWSLYVALATLVATGLWRTGLLAGAQAAVRPWYGDPPFTRSHYLFLAFTGWISLTYVTAESHDRAWPYFIEYVKIFVMFVCAALVIRTVREVWVIYYVVLGAAVYIGYEINMYYLGSGWLILASRGYGGLDNNGAALILAMAVPMCFFAWEAVRHPARWGFLLVIPVLLHAVLLSYSRGAMLSLCVVAPLVLLRTRHKWMVGLLYLVVLASVPVMAGKEVRDRFLSISEHSLDESAISRKKTWEIAATMANERPLFGFGIRNSNLYTHAYGADMYGRSIHSQYLQTAADSGWVALALYLGLLLSVYLGLRSARKALRPYRDPATDRIRSLASGIETALALFCFGALFLSLEHFEMPYVLMLLALQVHAITRAVQARVGPPPAPTAPAAAPVAGAAP